jgi:PAS domain S-box-containing protein
VDKYFPDKSPLKLFEGLMLAFITLLGHFLIFGPLPIDSYRLQGNLLMPIFVWGILRFGYSGLAFTSLCFAGFGIWGITHGHGPYMASTFLNSMLFFQSRIAIVSGIGLILGSILADRRAALKALQLSNQEMERHIQERTAELRKFKLIIENAGEEFYLSNLDGTIAYVNETAARSLGYTQEELIGSNLKRLDGNFKNKEQLKKFNQNKEKQRSPFDICHKAKDGSLIPKEIRVIRLNIDGDDYICGFAHDVTGRMRAQLALKKERDLAQQYLDIAAVMLVVLDNEGKITLINKKGCQMLGYREEELIGKRWIDHCIPPEARKEIEPMFQDLCQGKVRETNENPIVTRDGMIRLMAFRNSTIRENDKITGILFSGEDITEKRRAEQELIDSEEKYRSIFTSVNDAIFIFDPETYELIDCNSRATELFEYSFEEFVAAGPQCIYSNIHPHTFDETANRIKEICEGGGNEFLE